MCFSRNIKKSFSALSLALLAICLNGRETEDEYSNKIDMQSDFYVQIYSKIVWQMTVQFVQEENMQFTIVGKYHVASSHNAQHRLLGITKFPVTSHEKLKVDLKTLKYNLFSSAQLRYNAEKGTVFRDIMNQIAPNFFDLSNREKMEAMEQYVASQRAAINP